MYGEFVPLLHILLQEANNKTDAVQDYGLLASLDSLISDGMSE